MTLQSENSVERGLREICEDWLGTTNNEKVRGCLISALAVHVRTLIQAAELARVRKIAQGATDIVMMSHRSWEDPPSVEKMFKLIEAKAREILEATKP